MADKIKFGGVEFDEIFGGYTINTEGGIPQDAATAMGAVNSELLGATYEPLVYVGKQVVNGINYLFICKEIRLTKNSDVAIVGVVVNVPAGEGSVQGKGAKIVNIIEDAQLSEKISTIFETATRSLVGARYRALAYIGSKVVKGTNYYFICEMSPVYPNAEPEAVTVCINVFENNILLKSVNPIKSTTLGYAFTW